MIRNHHDTHTNSLAYFIAFYYSHGIIFSMKIAIIAPLEESVPPSKYGGIERVVYHLVEELVKLGHRVTVLASGDSVTSARLIPVFPKALRAMPALANLKIRDSYKLIGLGKIISYLQQNNFDIIHNHFDIGWVQAFEQFLTTPLVTTLHKNLLSEYEYPFYQYFPHSRYISISMNQRRALPKLNYIANVYNGLDFTKYHFSPTPSNYFAFLGRMSPNKGPLQAIQVIKRAKQKLIMAAKVDSDDVVYFTKKIKPLIDGKQISFIGEVNEPKKIKLLSKAQALIAPIQWEEPFGLYFTEAMACGTPVITLQRGSAKEVITHQQTGFVCRDLTEMVKSTKKIQLIQRQNCYNHVHTGGQFLAVDMAKHYLAAYQQVILEHKK